jgi:hypothetical protein
VATERCQVPVTSAIGLPNKAYNARRNPKVALLFSDPTGSGLPNPPTVVVQGDAIVSELITWDGDPVSSVWDDTVKAVGRFPSAVLTGTDPDGYPVSVRSQPVPDDACCGFNCPPGWRSVRALRP